MSYVSQVVEATNANVNTLLKLQMAGVRTRVQTYQVIGAGRQLLQFNAEGQVHGNLMANDPQYAQQVAGVTQFAAPAPNAAIEERFKNIETCLEKIMKKLG